MKKYLILASILAIASACTKTYEVTPNQTEIGFCTWAELLTKTVSDPRVQGTSSFITGDSFAVSGYKVKNEGGGGESKVTVFDKQVVEAKGTASAAPTSWDYTPHRFWDANFDKYYFFAVSPSSVVSADGVTFAPQTGALAGVNCSFNGKNCDILVANKTAIAKSDGKFNNWEPVVITFNHAAAKVNVYFRKSATLGEGADVKITSLTISGIKTSGTLAVSSYNGSNIPAFSWTPDGAVADGVTGATAGMTDCSANINTAIAARDAWATSPSSAGTLLISNYIVMPQDLSDNTSSGQRLTVTYTITTGGETITYENKVITFAKFDNGDNTTTGSPDTYVAPWAAGKEYIYYVTIDAHSIEFTGTITDWDPIKGYNYLLN